MTSFHFHCLESPVQNTGITSKEFTHVVDLLELLVKQMEQQDKDMKQNQDSNIVMDTKLNTILSNVNKIQIQQVNKSKVDGIRHTEKIKTLAAIEKTVDTTYQKVSATLDKFKNAFSNKLSYVRNLIKNNNSNLMQPILERAQSEAPPKPEAFQETKEPNIVESEDETIEV